MDTPQKNKHTPKKSNKCNICKKKNVTNMICNKCDKMFCIKHLCPENHNCCHNHKKDLVMLEKIVASKIEVI